MLVEILVCEKWNQLGVIPLEDLNILKTNIKINYLKFLKIEKIVKHDVIAFTRMLSESLGDEKRWIHLGLTSSDIVDTSQNYLIKQSNIIVENLLIKLIHNLKIKSLIYKQQIIMGRTHGMFAEPTSLGLKFLSWYEEAQRNLKRFQMARKNIEVVKLSGSLGNFAHLEIEIEEYIAKKLNLFIDPITTQITSRDRHIQLFTSLAQISNLLEKIAIEFRHLQRSEINELFENFHKNQKGSSSMPHKKNPIDLENISGLGRLIRSNMILTFENNLLWHERDISHSSNERIIIPDTYNLIVFIIKKMINIINNINVNQKNILKNINSNNNIFYSQIILTEIIKNTKYSREEIYDLIQKCALEAQQKNKNFKKILIKNNIKKYIKIHKMNNLFNLNYFLRNIDKIYKRVFK